MAFARITAGGRATIPERIREAMGLTEGDLIAFEIEDDRVVLRKVGSDNDRYLQDLTSTLSEWDSPEDGAAWRDL